MTVPLRRAMVANNEAQPGAWIVSGNTKLPKKTHIVMSIENTMEIIPIINPHLEISTFELTISLRA
jgi:hypothetical protein